MTTAATIAARLTLDSSDYDKGMKGAEKTADKFVDKMEKVGKKMQKIGIGMTASLTVPIVLGIKKGVELASAYEEALNKVNVVFEDSSKVIEDWAKGSAQSLGLSEGAALAAAGTFGNLFTAQGMGVDAAADMSTAVVQLSADLASFNDANPEDVLLALRSGLSGEIEPLKKFGVAMNEALLKTKAMEMGLGDNLKALTEAEKVQVRYAIIMDQTTKAQGDFARTSDGLANTQRQLNAQWEDTLRLLGENFLPMVLKITTSLNNMLQALAEAPPFTRNVVTGLLVLVALAGPLLTLVGTVLSMASSLATLGVSFAGVSAAVSAFGVAAGAALTTILPILLLIAAIVAVVFLAWKNWDQIVVIAKDMGAELKKTFKIIGDGSKKAFAQMKKNSADSKKAMLKDLIDWTVGALEKFNDFRSRVINVFRSITSAFTSIFQRIVAVASSVFNSIARAIAQLIGYVNQLIQSFKNIVLPDALTPGSPTPFEIGLRGIGDAMKSITGSSIPDMNAGLSRSPAAIGQAGGGRTTYNDNRTFGSGMGADELRTAFQEKFVGDLADRIRS